MKNLPSIISETVDTRKISPVLIKQAKEVLDQNWTGSFTQPASSLYPHQWSWDSAFIAIGYAHYDQRRAQQELRRLFSGQWRNGMVPHIVFNGQEENSDYFPGPDFWQTDGVSQAPGTPATSGICQPPIHATAVRHLLTTVPGRREAQKFASDLFPKLKSWHNFLYRERDPQHENLVYIRHPWSSGQDNAPIWDRVLDRLELDEDQIPKYNRADIKYADAAERPTDKNYDQYIYLVDFFRRRGYDEQKIYEDNCPFMVQDVLFNTLLCQASRDLGQIAEWLGENAAPFHKQAMATANAINKKLWNEEDGIYFNYDLGADKQLPVFMLSGVLPLFAGIPSPARAEKIFEYLNTHNFARVGKSAFAVPGYDRNEPEFSPQRYWRGPIWINLNWLLFHGLSKYGYNRYNRFIKRSVIELCKRSGFYEYYNPDDGRGYGASQFAWSSALLIDILGSDFY
ncbi:MAG: amylo-alpha-1,6-glucosidase [Candidatus Halalkalibacterium sp. M3_1C_030]